MPRRRTLLTSEQRARMAQVHVFTGPERRRRRVRTAVIDSQGVKTTEAGGPRSYGI